MTTPPHGKSNSGKWVVAGMLALGVTLAIVAAKYRQVIPPIQPQPAGAPTPATLPTAATSSAHVG